MFKGESEMQMRNLNWAVGALAVAAIFAVAVNVPAEGPGPWPDTRLTHVEQVKRAFPGERVLAFSTWDEDDQTWRTRVSRVQRPRLRRGEGVPCPFDYADACKSDTNCESELDKACRDHGHGGVNKESVRIITHADGSKTCSGDGTENGAKPFITFNATTSGGR
jgi:hypothetical protein